MPEIPEITIYLEALQRKILGQRLQTVRIRSVSLLRTWDPPPASAEGRKIVGFRRLGKRIVWELEDGLFFVFHLMISGRFRWKKRGAPIPKKGTHAAFDFPDGTLVLSEAATHKRASLHVVRGEHALAGLDPGGVEPLQGDLASFGSALARENHTLKRALTDPRILSGIGNAHSDEILHAARLSPLKRTARLSVDEIERLHAAVAECLNRHIERLRHETGTGFPDRITAFHPALRVHGRFGKPCGRCGATIQRIVHGESETNYCPVCQTGGRLLRDRALSRLLRDDWPRTPEELEER